MDEQTIKEEVRKLMYANSRTGYSKFLKKHYSYIEPSPQKYPFQWFWDSFFHIFILCALEEHQLARDNLESLFSRQEEDGFVGHMIYWKSLLPPSIWQIVEAHPTLQQFRPHMSAIIQPSFAAQALERICNNTQDEEYLRKIFPKIKRYHEWLIVNRSFEDNPLLFIISPFESGLDEKPSYDALVGIHPKKGTFGQYVKLMWLEAKNFWRGYDVPRIYRANDFIVKDVVMNTIYALDLFAFSRLCRKMGDDIESARFNRLAKQVTRSMLELMFDEQDAAFYDLAGHDNKKLRTLSFSIFFPVVLPGIPPEISRKIIERHLLNDKEFNLPFPIPTVAKSEDIFNPEEAASRFFDFLWRGPTWALPNWFLYEYLLTNQYPEIADRLLTTMKRLIELSGFREYYNPFTGEGYGAKNFTWPGLIVDMLRIRDENKKPG
jgi:glycogen debranching enzyme